MRWQPLNPLTNMDTTNILKWVIEVQVLDGYRLLLTFNDGKRRIFDCNPIIEKYPLFAPLRDEAVFSNITFDGWTVTWLDGTLDIAPEHLYEAGAAA